MLANPTTTHTATFGRGTTREFGGAHPATAQLRCLLAQATQPCGLTPGDISALIDGARLVSWDEGATACSSFDRDGSIGFLVSGAVRIELELGVGDPQVMHVVAPGELFCVPPSPVGGEYRVLAVAHMRSLVALFGSTALGNVLASLSRDALAKVAVASWLALSRIAEEQCLLRRRRLECRVLHMLDRLARRFGRAALDGPGTMIDLRLRCLDIARLVGASRANVNRCLKALERRARLRRVDGRIVLAVEPGRVS